MDSSGINGLDRGQGLLDPLDDSTILAGAPSSTAGAAAGAMAEGSRATTRLDARIVKRVMREIRPIKSRDLATDAAHVLADHGPTGHDGAFGQVSGKVHEFLAAHRHNHRLTNVIRGSKIRLIDNPQSPIVDAVRKVRGSVVETISYKKSAAGAAKAAAKTPAHVRISVPTDQVASAARSIGTQAGSSGVSRSAVDVTTTRGAGALAAKEAAGSLARAGARAGVIGALSSAVIGGVTDYVRHVRHGHMTWRRFVVERGADGAEGAVGAASGVAAAGAVAAAMTGTALATGTVAPVALAMGAAIIVGVAASKVTTKARRAITGFAVDKVARRRSIAAASLALTDGEAYSTISSQTPPTSRHAPDTCSADAEQPRISSTVPALLSSGSLR